MTAIASLPCFPQAELTRCAASTKVLDDGRIALRLCLKDLPDPDFRVKVVARVAKERFEGLLLKELVGATPFTVRLAKGETVVWVEDVSLWERFQVSKRLMVTAGYADDLMRIIAFPIVQKDLSQASAFSVRAQKNFHFSRKDFDLQESLYVTPEIVAFGVRGFIRKGAYARVKQARTLDGKVIARRIRKIDVSENPHHETETLAMIQRLRVLKNKPGVIDLLGACDYIPGKMESREVGQSRRKIVTFHSLYPKDLIDVFLSEQIFTKEIQYNLIEQLFVALTSLNGAHGDLKPDNILVDDTTWKIALTDLDYFRPNEVTGTHFKGSIRWMCPASLRGQEVTVQKMDVWALGIILLGILEKMSPAAARGFSWQSTRMLNLNMVLSYMTPENVVNRLRNSVLSEEECSLLFGMIEIDVNKRMTIHEAADYFRAKVAPTLEATKNTS